MFVVFMFFCAWDNLSANCCHADVAVNQTKIDLSSFDSAGCVFGVSCTSIEHEARVSPIVGESDA